MMRVENTNIEGVWVVENKTFTDERGSFMEVFQLEAFYTQTKLEFKPVQWNQSISKKGSLRGIHYSVAPQGQSKWVNCSVGTILDTVVDLREGSPTFAQNFQIDLSENNQNSLVIESGIGHSFLALENDSVVDYLLTSRYAPNYELGILPLDESLGIDWPSLKYYISDKDLKAPTLEQARREKLLPTKGNL